MCVCVNAHPRHVHGCVHACGIAWHCASPWLCGSAWVCGSVQEVEVNLQPLTTNVTPEIRCPSILKSPSRCRSCFLWVWTWQASRPRHRAGLPRSCWWPGGFLAQLAADWQSAILPRQPTTHVDSIFPPTGYVVRQVMFASHFQPPPPPLPSPPLPPKHARLGACWG